jgi:hypothetical protein
MLAQHAIELCPEAFDGAATLMVQKMGPELDG